VHTKLDRYLHVCFYFKTISIQDVHVYDIVVCLYRSDTLQCTDCT
jgi:hypothetical protein